MLRNSAPFYRSNFIVDDWLKLSNLLPAMVSAKPGYNLPELGLSSEHHQQMNTGMI